MLTNDELKNEILNKIHKLGIKLVGFASIERWSHPPPNSPNTFKEWIPPEYYPQNIYPETKTVIVIGLPVPLPVIETTPSIYYHELYNTLNQLLDQKAYEIADYLTSKGYPSISLPRDAYSNIAELIKNPYTFFLHKHAAYLAGLGSFGQNNVLLTPEYGPRVRFTSILTTAQIKSTPLKNIDYCTHCHQCMLNCPIHAIPPETTDYFPPPVNKITCAKYSKKLRNQNIAPCGICIKTCPVGADRKTYHRQDPNIYTDSEKYSKHHKAWKHVQRKEN
jgi:epoxyqueuosine reductase QueG